MTGRWWAGAAWLAAACAASSASERAAPATRPAAAVMATAPEEEQEATATESNEEGTTEPAFGSPEDRALWGELKSSTADAVLHLARVAQCAFRIRYAHPYEELDARAADATAGEEARALRARLASEAEAAQAAVPPDGGRAHECRYALLHLEQAMEFPEEPGIREDAGRRRDDARRCADRMHALAAAVAPRADALEETLAAVDAFVLRTPRPQPAQAASPAAPAEGAR